MVYFRSNRPHTMFRFIKQLFAIGWLLSLHTNTTAQIDTAQQLAQAISYWQLHETQSYTINFTQFEVVGNDTIKTIDIESVVKIEVVDSTMNSFTINWKYTAVTSLIHTPASTWIAQFLNLQEIQFETNELGVFKKIDHPKEYSKLRDAFMAKQEVVVGESIEDNCIFTNYFTEKQGLGIQELQSIHQFHNFHGLAYHLNETLEGRLKEAEKVNGVTVPGTIKVTLEQLYPERKTFVLRSTKALSSQVFEQAMTANATESNLTGSYTNETTTLSVMHVSGWVILSNQTKTIVLPNKKIIEERVIRMNETE